MTLKEQIISLLFSFLYGVLTQKIYNLSYNNFHSNKKTYNFINSLLFMIDITLIYFKVFYIINDGIVNTIFIIITITTFLYFNNRNLQKKCKNMCN